MCVRKGQKQNLKPLCIQKAKQTAARQTKLSPRGQIVRDIVKLLYNCLIYAQCTQLLERKMERERERERDANYIITINTVGVQCIMFICI